MHRRSRKTNRRGLPHLASSQTRLLWISRLEIKCHLMSQFLLGCEHPLDDGKYPPPKPPQWVEKFPRQKRCCSHATFEGLCRGGVRRRPNDVRRQLSAASSSTTATSSFDRVL